MPEAERHVPGVFPTPLLGIQLIQLIKTAMADEFGQVKPSDVTSLDKLKGPSTLLSSRCLFVDDCYESGMFPKLYMKTLLTEKYHDRGPSEWDTLPPTPYYDASLFIHESYSRVKGIPSPEGQRTL